MTWKLGGTDYSLECEIDSAYKSQNAFYSAALYNEGDSGDDSDFDYELAGDFIGDYDHAHSGSAVKYGRIQATRKGPYNVEIKKTKNTKRDGASDWQDVTVTIKPW